MESKMRLRGQIMAIAWLVAGILYKKMVVEEQFGLWATLGLLLLYGCGVATVLLLGRKPTKVFWGLYAMGAVMSMSLVFTASYVLCAFAQFYGFFCYLLAVSFAYMPYVGQHFLSQGLYGIAVYPFLSLGTWFVSLFSKKENKNSTVGYIIVGLLISVIPCIIIGSLLSYDANFTDILSRMFGDMGAIFDTVGDLLFGLVFAVFLFAHSQSAIRLKMPEEEYFVQKEETRRVFPWAAVLGFVLPLMFLYGVFFVSQWQYFVSGFTGALPQGYSYADYARSGFFELCAVATINAVLLLIISVCTKKNTVTKICSVALSVATLLLITVAMSKMILYIVTYGLTQLRVYTTWFMLFMAICFVLVIVSQFTRLRLSFSVFAAGSIFLCLLLFGGVDGRIAEYNVNAYRTGKIEKMDVDAMYDLSAEAVPYVLSLLDDNIPEYLRAEVMEYATEQKAELDTKVINIATIEAKQALEKYNIK